MKAFFLIFGVMITTVFVFRRSYETQLSEYRQQHESQNKRILATQRDYVKETCQDLGVVPNAPPTEAQTTFMKDTQSDINSYIQGGSNPVEKIVNDLISGTDSGESSFGQMVQKTVLGNTRLLMYIGTWAVCVGCTVLICLCTWVQYCSEKLFSCCCSCCKRDPKPGKFASTWPVVCTILGAVLSVIFVILAQSQQGGMVLGATQLGCSAQSFISTVLDGQTFSDGKKFCGVTKVAVQVVGIINTLTVTLPDSIKENLSGGIAPMQQGQAKLLSDIGTLWNTYGTSKFGNPDPLSSGDITPAMWEQWGPPTKEQTGLNALYQQYEAMFGIPISNFQMIAEQSAKIIGQTSDSMEATLSSSQVLLDSLQKQLKDVQSSSGDTIVNFHGQIEKFTYAVWGVMGIVVVIAIINLVIAICIKCGTQLCSCCLHVNWCVLALIAILYLTLATIFNAVSIALLDACQVTDQMLLDEANFNKTIGKYITDEDVKGIILPCLFGNGELNLPIGDSIDQIQNYTSGVQNTSSIPINSLKLNPVGDMLKANNDKAMKGTFPIDPRFNAALATANGWANFNAAGGQSSPCTGSQDTFVVDKGSCTNQGSQVLTNVNEYFGQKACVPLNTWSTAQLQSRYASFPTGCAGDSNYANPKLALDAYTASLKSFLTSSDAILTDINTVYADLQLQQNDLADKMGVHIGKIQNFYTDIQNNLVDQILGPTSFLQELNCKFIKYAIDGIILGLCAGLAPPLFWFSLYLGLVGCCGCCLIRCTFSLNWNLGVPDSDEDGSENGDKKDSDTYQNTQVELVDVSDEYLEVQYDS